MKGDIQPPFSEVAYKSQDPIEHNTIPLFDHTPDTRLHLDFVQQDVVEYEDNVPLVWKRKGKIGANEQEPIAT